MRSKMAPDALFGLLGHHPTTLEPEASIQEPSQNAPTESPESSGTHHAFAALGFGALILMT